MARCFLREQILDGIKSLFPRIEFHIFKAQEDNGIFSLIFTVLVSASPDLLVLEIYRGIFVRLFKERAEHIHIQSFSEAARAREKRDHRTFIKKILDHHGLIDIVIFCRRQAIIGNADRERQIRLANGRYGLYATVCRFCSIDRNRPSTSFLNSSVDFSFSAELTYLSITDSPETCRLFRAHHFMHGSSSKYNFTDTLYHIIGTMSRTLFGTIFGTM